MANKKNYPQPDPDAGLENFKCEVVQEMGISGRSARRQRKKAGPGSPK